MALLLVLKIKLFVLILQVFLSEFLDVIGVPPNKICPRISCRILQV